MTLKEILRPTLNKKLVSMMLVLNLCLIAAIVLLYSQTEKVLYSEFERQTSSLLKAVQIGLEEATSQGVSDEKRLQDFLSKLNLKGVTEVSIISNSDRIISSTNRKDVGKWVTRNKKELIVKADLGEPVTGEGETYFIMIPVVVGQKNMGYLHLRMSTENFSTFLRASLIRRVLAASLIFAIGIALAVMLAHRYTKPIREAVDAANRIASGDLDVNLSTTRHDEIGELTRSFNYMAGRLMEEKTLRERLRRTEHLASIGEMAQSVAHEIKNPLNFISLSADHLSEAYMPEDPEKAARFASLIGNMKSEVQRVSRFLQGFLELGKPLGLTLRNTDISELVGRSFELVSARARQDNIELVTDFRCRPCIQADPELLKTCIFNIIINALQSMPKGGRLTARTSCDEGRIMLSFEDTGSGVPEDKLHLVFTPYYTTKSDGLGLGLALTKRIVEEHGGRITLASAEGKGSTVTLSFESPANGIVEAPCR